MKTIDNRGIRNLVMAAVLSIGSGLLIHGTAQAQPLSYLIDLKTKTTIDLGNVYARAINDTGQLAGWSYTADGGNSRAFITGPNGVGRTDLGTLPGGDWSEAYGINDAGQVVGYSAMAGGNSHAFITGPNGLGMRDLGTLPGGNRSSASGINDAGQVVGTSYTSDNWHTGHAFITGPNGVGMTDLGTLGGAYSRAYGINNAGQVVGDSETADGQDDAFITGPNGAGMTELDAPNGTAYGINDAGQVVGDSLGRAFITGPNGVGMTVLGTLGESGSFSFATGINDAGQVVGISDRNVFSGSDYNIHAFITGPDRAGMTDLNSLGAPDIGYTTAAINNVGQVLVSAVPEPESYALMLAGLVLAGVMIRRKQKVDALDRVLGL